MNRQNMPENHRDQQFTVLLARKRKRMIKNVPKFVLTISYKKNNWNKTKTQFPFQKEGTYMPNVINIQLSTSFVNYKGLGKSSGRVSKLDHSFDSCTNVCTVAKFTFARWTILLEIRYHEREMNFSTPLS